MVKKLLQNKREISNVTRCLCGKIVTHFIVDDQNIRGKHIVNNIHKMTILIEDVADIGEPKEIQLCQDCALRVLNLLRNLNEIEEKYDQSNKLISIKKKNA